jgi:hypothetical protein
MEENNVKDPLGILGKKPTQSQEDPLGILKKKVEPTPLPSSSQLPLEGGTSGLTATPSVSTDTPTETYTVKPGTSFNPFAEAPKMAGQKTALGNTLTPSTEIRPVTTTAGSTPTAEKTVNIPKEKESTSMLEDLSSSFLRGSSRLGSMLAKTPAFIYDIAAYPQNKIAELTGLDISASSEELANTLGLPENEIAKYYDNAVAESQKKLNEKYDKGITDYFKSGDYSKAFGLLANSVVESAPISISLALGNAAGLTTAQSIMGGGAVFAADKKSELDTQNPNMTESSKVENALANGLLEGVFENFGVTKLGSMTKDILLKEGVEQGKEIVKNGFKEVYLPVLKKYIGTTAEESISEAATQYAQNAVDKFSGAKPNIDLMEGVLDAAIIGLGSGVSMSSAPAALELSRTRDGFKRAVEIQSEKQVLENDLVSEAIPLESKQILSDKLKDLTSEEADLVKSEKIKYESLSSDQQKSVDALIDKKRKLIDGITNIPLSEDSKSILQKDLDNIDNEIESIYSNPMKEQEEALNEEEYLKSIQSELEARKKPKVEIPESENKMQREGLFEVDDTQKAQPIELPVETTQAAPEITTEEKPAQEIKKEEPTVNVDDKIAEVQKKIQDNKQNYFNEKISYVDYRKNNDALEADLKKLESGEQVEQPKIEENVNQENIQGIPSEIGIGEKPIQAEPIETTSAEETTAGGVLQAPEEKVVEQVVAEKKPTPTKTQAQISAEQTIAEEEDTEQDNVTEDAATVKKMDDDVEVLKGYNKEKYPNKTPAELKKLIEDKYVGVLARAYKAKMDGKISGPTYTAYRNELNKMMEEKLRPFTKKVATGAEGDNIKKGELKAQVVALGEMVKEKLLGEGYKNLALSSAIPGASPEIINKLVDLTVKGVNFAIDAGYGVREATQIALDKINTNPVYKKLYESGNIDETKFRDSVESELSKAKAQPQPKAQEKQAEEQEAETGKEVEAAAETGMPVITQEDITKESKGKRKQSQRREENTTYDEINKMIPQEASFYQKMDQEQIRETIRTYINELEASNMIMDAANLMLDENAKKPMPPEMVHTFNLFLVDRMKTLAKEVDNPTLKQDLLNKASRLRENNDKNTTTIAKSLANLYIHTKEMMSSPEGVQAASEQRQINAIDSYLNKKQKTALESVAEPVNSLINSEEFAEEVRKATEQKLKDIAEKTKGKDWVSKVDAFDDLITTTEDC